MLVLKKIFDKPEIIEVTSLTDCVSYIAKAYGMVPMSSYNIIKIFEKCENLIVQPVCLVVLQDLYITDANRFYLSGRDSNELINIIKKYSSEFFIVDGINLHTDRIEFRMHPLQDSWIHDTIMPALRKTIIDNILKDL